MHSKILDFFSKNGYELLDFKTLCLFISLLSSLTLDEPLLYLTMDMTLYFNQIPDKSFKIISAFLGKNKSPLVDLVFNFLDRKTLQKSVEMSVEPLK